MSAAPSPPLLRRAVLVRVVPMLVFMAWLALRGQLGTASAPAVQGQGAWWFDVRWLYGVQVAAVAVLLLGWWRHYGEFTRQRLPSAREWALAVVAGLAVFAAWIHLDAPWMTLGSPSAPFVPRLVDGRLDWSLILMRGAGAVLVVPIMEELFWRSFLMRWVDDARFEVVQPESASIKAIVLSTFVFVLAHTLWLAAAVAGLVYAWLYRSTGKLWVAVVAHAVTNAALAAWVIHTGQWRFW